MVNFCVVIVTFNAEKWIRKTLDSVGDATVLLVDNNSSDQTIKVASSYKNVSVTESSSNLGFGAANNLGIAMALELKSEYILLLNQDASIRHGDIKRAADKFSQHPDIGINSPIHFNGAGTELDFGFQEYVQPDRCQGFQEDYAAGSLKGFYEVPFVNAAAWLIPARVLKVTGGFHPAFFHYGEDKEYINRLHRLGYKTVIDPSWSICHDRPQHRTNNPYFTDLERMKRRYTIEVYDANDPQANYVKLRRNVMKSMVYQLAKANFTQAGRYRKVIIHLDSLMKKQALHPPKFT